MGNPEAVWFERGKVVYLAEDGREIEFDVFDLPDHVLRPGQEVYEPINQLTLRFRRHDLIEIETHDGETREFAPPTFRGEAPRSGWWRLQRRRTRARHEIALTYDDRGNLQWVRDSGGRVIAFDHDDQNRLVRVRLPHPTQDGFIDYVRYFYDTEGDLVQVTDPLGASWTFAYKRHLMVRETNRNGLSFYFAYDGWGSDAYCVRTRGDGGIYDHVIDYSKGAMTVVTNSLGYKTAYMLNAIGQVVEVVDARGGSTKYEYDERTLKPKKVTSPDGAETTTEYDDRGNVTKITRPDATELQVEYSARNEPLRAVDPLGGEWRWAYDSAGHQIGRIDPAAGKVQFHWGEAGLIAFTDAAGQHTQFAYDGAGNLSQAIAPDGTAVTWTHDRLGRVITETDSNGNVSTRYCDALGRIWRVDEPDTNSRELARDPEGNALAFRDRHHDVRFDYRGMNRLAARTEADRRVEFEYDTEEHLVGIKNEHGLAYRFVMDPAGGVIEEHGFDGLRRKYERDVGGRITAIERPEGKKTEYTYDQLGRVVAAKHHDGTSETYQYRKDGALAVAENNAIRLVFERDPLGRVLKETQGDDWVASEYDALGRRSRVHSSKGLAQRIRRNGMGKVVAVDASVAGASSTTDSTGRGIGAPTGSTFGVTFERDQLGLELQRTLPGGIRARWQRDSVGKPLRQEIWSEQQGMVTARQYQWDGNDRLQRVIDAMTGPVQYNHDAVGNLSHATYADGRVDLRMPDAVGNLFKTSDRSDRTYGPAGQLLEIHDARGTTRHEYDVEGNLVRKTEPDGATWTYVWNASALLCKIVRPNGTEVTFSYDPLGRRVSKAYGGKTTRWIWDGNVPLHEWVESTLIAGDEEPIGRGATQDGERALEALLARRPAIGPPTQPDQLPRQQAAAREGTAEAP